MSSELVAVELQLKGYEGVMSDMRALDQMLNGFRGKKNRIEIESGLSEAKKEVIALQGELNKLNSIKLTLGEYGKSSEGLNNKIKETRERLRDAQQAVKEFQYALKNLSGTSWGKVFSKITSDVAHLGSAMQSAGNALTHLTSPFARFTSGMVMGAGYKALNKFTEGLESGFARADTMRKYTRLMAEYETKNYTAEKSVKALDDSVQGLPIALDDAVGLAQRYTLSLGDMERGTNLAIATNNAFLASMATENQRYQGMLQMQDLLNGKDLNSREWMSLGASMGKAINEVGKEFGYTSDNMGEFRQELYAGNIATEDFLNALEKVGTGEGSLVKLAQESANTWEAFFSRIGTASSRMVYGILTSMDELVNSMSGGKFTTLNALFDDYLIGNIDKMTASIKGWIKAHPQEIVEFGKALKSIKWGSILKGVGEAYLRVADFIVKLGDIFGGKDLSWIGKFMVYGNFLGKFLTIGGGLLKGSRHPIGGIGATIFELVKGVKGIRKYGLMGWLGKMMTVGEEATEGKQAIDTVTKTAPKMGKFASGLSSIFKGWGQIATMVGGTALVGWGSMKLFKNTVKTFGETIELVKGIDWTTGASVLKKMGVFFGALLGLSSIAGHFASASGTVLAGEVAIGFFTTLALGFADLDMHLLKDSLKSLADATSYFDPIAKNIEAFKGLAFSDASKENIRNAIESLNSITDIVTGEFDADSHQRKGGLKNFSKTHAETLENIKKSADMLVQISNITVDSEKLGGVTTSLTDALTSIDTMLTNIPSGLGDKGTVDTTANLSSITSNLKTAFSSLIGKGGILNQIPKIVEKVKAMTADPEANMLTEFKLKMAELGKTFEEAYKGLAGKLRGSGDLMQRVTNFADAVLQARRVLYHLGKLNTESKSVNIDEGVGVIETTVANLKKAFSAKKIGELKQQIDAFVTSIKDALQTIADIGAKPIEIDATVQLSGNFNSSVNKVVGEIRRGRSKIYSAWNGIPTSLYKKVTIRIAVDAVVSGIEASVNKINQGLSTVAGKANDKINANSSTGGQISRNGVLYRSGGGSIFKPRGVDKIPAMLAEGEYVHKKQAVDFFGIDFMRRVNAMDVRGAMDALLTKAGTAVGVGRQSIVNNTVNNNQRITQNINTNNPNFARARMGRFVGAL